MKNFFPASMFLKWTLILSILATFAGTAESIVCFQCNSTDTDKPHNCTEFSPENDNIMPTPCADVTGAKYCTKFIGQHAGGWETIRSCSSVDHGDQCISGSQTGDQRYYRSCTYTCSTDGCNSADNTKTCYFLMLIPVALSAMIY